MNTKEIILSNAKELISEIGFHKTTTALLAKRANISEGTIYRHFESKEDVLLHILEDLEAKYVEFIDAMRLESPYNECSLEKVLEKHFEFVKHNEEDIKIMLSTYSILKTSRRLMESVSLRLREFFEELLTRGQAKGVIRDAPVPETAWMIVVFMFGLSRAQLYWSELSDLSGEAVEFCRRSLAVEA
ncbi:MAG: TetR/AcrR family transcriptional regulator [Desulfovibrionaceae bacterium]